MDGTKDKSIDSNLLERIDVLLHDVEFVSIVDEITFTWPYHDEDGQLDTVFHWPNETDGGRQTSQWQARAELQTTGTTSLSVSGRFQTVNAHFQNTGPSTHDYMYLIA